MPYVKGIKFHPFQKISFEIENNFFRKTGQSEHCEVKIT